MKRQVLSPKFILLLNKENKLGGVVHFHMAVVATWNSRPTSEIWGPADLARNNRRLNVIGSRTLWVRVLIGLLSRVTLASASRDSQYRPKFRRIQRNTERQCPSEPRVPLTSADVKFRRGGHGSQAVLNNSFQMVTVLYHFVQFATLVTPDRPDEILNSFSSESFSFHQITMEASCFYTGEFFREHTSKEHIYSLKEQNAENSNL